MATTVVNIKRGEAFDVYVGRAGHGQDGYWGNPFRAQSEADRETVIAKFRVYFLDRVARDAEFRRRALGLRGKRLSCFCSPRSCHGDVIVEWLEGVASAEQGS